MTTMNEVRRLLESDEPDYTRAAALGAEVLPHVAILARGDNSYLAGCAVSLAGMIPGKESLAIIDEASRHSDADMRFTAAGALEEFARHSGIEDEIAAISEIAERLLHDSDPGARKFAARAAAQIEATHAVGGVPAERIDRRTG